MQVVSLVLHVKSIWVTLIMFRSSWLHVKTHNEVMRCVCLQPEHLEFKALHEGTIFLQIDTAHPWIVATQKQAVKKIVPIWSEKYGIHERVLRSIFECTQLHNFMQRVGLVGPSSGVQCWTLYIVCSVPSKRWLKGPKVMEQWWIVCKHPCITYPHNLCPRDRLFKIQTTIKYEVQYWKAPSFRRPMNQHYCKRFCVALGEIIYLIAFLWGWLW